MTSAILIVEDDAKFAQLLAHYLGENGFAIEVVARGDVAAERIVAEPPPRLVILDLMLPGLDGLEVIKQVRPRYGGPILMLTARKGEVDEVLGLELGADDYVTKPAYPRVLLARVRSLLRRYEAETEEPASSRRVGKLSLHRKKREALVGGEIVKLTSIEFDVLWTLADSPGEVVSRDRLYLEIHGHEHDGIDRGMDIHLSRIRQKLSAMGLDGGAIKSVRGSGYLLALE